MTNNGENKMTKEKYYYQKRIRFLNGEISQAEWMSFCSLYLYTLKQWQQTCKNLKKRDQGLT